MNAKVYALLMCCAALVLPCPAEAGLLGRLRGGSGGARGSSDDCADGSCGLLGRLRGGNEPVEEPIETPVETLAPPPQVIQQVESSGVPPWVYLIGTAPLAMILVGGLGGGAYFLARKMQESSE